jgi:tetratricopeptide (TPR) repeat protein
MYAESKNPSALQMADQLEKAPGANNPEQAEYIRGLYFSYSGDYNKAISYFDQCIKMNANDIIAYREKAIALYNLQNYQKSLEALQTALSIKADYSEGYFWEGCCYEKLNDKNKAIENYKKALQLDPSYDEAQEALLHLGVRVKQVQDEE